MSDHIDEQDDWKDATVIPYDDPKDAFRAGHYLGLVGAVDALERQAATNRQLPGFALARAIIAEMREQERANLALLCLRFAAKKGVDVSTNAVASNDRGVMYRPLDLEELSSA